MTQVIVDTRRDETMTIVSSGLDGMIEVGTGVRHGAGASQLAEGGKDEAEGGDRKGPDT